MHLIYPSSYITMYLFLSHNKMLRPSTSKFKDLIYFVLICDHHHHHHHHHLVSFKVVFFCYFYFSYIVVQLMDIIAVYLIYIVLFYFSARLWYILHVSQKLISSHWEFLPFCNSYYLFTLWFLSKQTRHGRNIISFHFFLFISGRTKCLSRKQRAG